MNPAYLLRQLLLVVCVSVIAGDVFAQEAKETFQPRVGQPGKDVIWVPTAQALVEKMLEVARVTANDYVIDLGSGDGRMVIAAAKRGARALGIEYNPELVELSKRNAAEAGVTDRATFLKADLFESDLSQATVITMFLLPDLNMKLRPKLLELKPGTRIVSNSYTMGAWSADQIVTADAGCVEFCAAYFWIVPAKVGGTWQLPEGELALKQSFQMVSGTLNSAGRTVQITNGRLAGGYISFNAGEAEYTGRVSGDAMEGTANSAGRKARWTATRK
jgi:phospholipid N-methyltransferase